MTTSPKSACRSAYTGLSSTSYSSFPMPRLYSCCQIGRESRERSPSSSSSMDLHKLQMKVLKPGTWQALPASSSLNWSQARHVRLWPVMPASSSSCLCSDFMRTNTIRAHGRARWIAIMRMMFSVSSCMGSLDRVFGSTKKALALNALTRSRSASSSTLPWNTWTCCAMRPIFSCFRWLVMTWMVSGVEMLDLGKRKMACKSSASSAWSGWYSSAMKSLIICTLGFPVITMCFARTPGM
mmetsp:Transcript_42874/g.122265  ORF Transcript_42874/g.122265 Transcript_42874/m.122265 type:complete len:239 (+) Transcript_42874:212-928(+)